MKNIIKRIFFLGLLQICISCGLIMEENISKSTITVYTPTDSFVTSNYTVSFKWDPVLDATQYRIQVVSPSFSSINSFAVDTVVTKTTVALTLSPGSYEWRMRAENSGTYTSYFKRSFVVQPGVFENQYVVLKSPAANYSTYATTVDLRWDTLYSSKEYLLEVDTFGSNYSTPIISERLPKGTTSYSLTMNKIGSFKWSVKGYNNTDYTQRSERTINFKLGVPIPTAPINGRTEPRPVSLQWTGGSNVDYLVYIYKADSVSIYDTQTYPFKTSSNSYSFNPAGINTTYFWSVRAIDKNGNKSDESVRRKVIVQ